MLPPDPLRCAALAPFGVLFALSASPAAPGPLPLRGSAPGRAARCRFAGPVRRSAPSGLFGPRRARPSAVPPRLPRSGSCAALRASAAARWPRCASALPSLRCGLPVRSPLLRLVLGSGASRVPRRVPPSPPASRLRGRLAPAPGALAALRAAFPAFGPRGLWAARPARAGLAALLRGCCGGCGLRPGLPPAPAAPSGGSRGARGPFGWASPPAAWVGFLPPLLRLPPGRCAAPGAAPAARLTVRKLSTGGLHEVCAPPPFSHCPASVKAALAAGAALAASAPMRCSPPALTSPGGKFARRA